MPGSSGRITITNLQERGTTVLWAFQRFSPEIDSVRKLKVGNDDYLRFTFDAAYPVSVTIQVSTNLVDWIDRGHVFGGDDVQRDVYLPSPSDRWFLRLVEWK